VTRLPRPPALKSFTAQDHPHVHPRRRPAPGPRSRVCRTDTDSRRKCGCAPDSTIPHAALNGFQPVRVGSGEPGSNDPVRAAAPSAGRADAAPHRQIAQQTFMGQSSLNRSQAKHHRAFQFEHQVVPLVTVFAAEIHPAHQAWSPSTGKSFHDPSKATDSGKYARQRGSPPSVL